MHSTNIKKNIISSLNSILYEALFLLTIATVFYIFYTFCFGMAFNYVMLALR